MSERLTQVLGNPHVQELVWISLGTLVFGLLLHRRVLPRVREGRSPGLATWLVLAGFLAVVSLRAVPTGDEPHYLIMVQSLWGEGDFDLRDNYERRDYREYYPYPIPDPHVIVTGPRWYPAHTIGLPLLVAPAYALGGRPGVVLLLTLLTAAGLGVLWSVLRLAGFEPGVSAAALAAAALTLPVAAMAGQVFPEVPAFFLVIIALRSILGLLFTAPDRLGLVLSCAVLPWLHPKYAVLAVALLLAAVVVGRRRASYVTLAGATAVLIGSVIGHATVSDRWYGAPLPGAGILVAQGSSPADWLAPLVGHFLVRPWVGLFGVLFDQQSGLFFAAPVYLLAVPGLVLLWRRNRALALSCALVFASVYLPAGSYGIWYGGYSSPARLLTPTVPVLALCLAAALQAGNRWVRPMFAVLVIPSLLHAYLMTALPSFTRYGDPATDHNFFLARLERMLEVELSPIFPSFRHVEPTTWLTTFGYILLLAALTVMVLPRDISSDAGTAHPRGAG